MGRYTRRLRDAPVSHIVAFLILHEITAIVPLFGLFGLFHYTDYVPIGYMTGNFGGQVLEGVRRFEKYFKRKGWFGFGSEDGAEDNGQTVDNSGNSDGSTVLNLWESFDAKYKIVVEIGLAYAITKALLPLRIVFSLSATPWFAGVLARLRGLRGPPKGK
ncbi:hypothetical protein CMQ_2123 [Grosmannia clavigera kw1407]|uniref:Uncharacterized protein n=1 Tax=Grosmannia clavigera (strain kw1407 / UAMH 11150) TaxID=655863 RepID=F0XJN9_GROCL|nr:uncharacterized protein CMQ_2123 [Grosmannia clavigera kw1407]EFX02074.1 hypothetical protein CMQ_2123 [Grosmannia clavigera kw1407]